MEIEISHIPWEIEQIFHEEYNKFFDNLILIQLQSSSKMKLTIFCRWSTILREMTMHKKVIFAVWRCKTGLLFAITFLANTNIRTF